MNTKTEALREAFTEAVEDAHKHDPRKVQADAWGVDATVDRLGRTLTRELRQRDLHVVCVYPREDGVRITVQKNAP